MLRFTTGEHVKTNPHAMHMQPSRQLQAESLASTYLVLVRRLITKLSSLSTRGKQGASAPTG